MSWHQSQDSTNNNSINHFNILPTISTMEPSLSTDAVDFTFSTFESPKVKDDVFLYTFSDNFFSNFFSFSEKE
jgi:hypothetical protein